MNGPEDEGSDGYDFGNGDSGCDLTVVETQIGADRN